MIPMPVQTVLAVQWNPGREPTIKAKVVLLYEVVLTLKQYSADL